MIDENGDCYLWSTNKRDWVIAWRVMGGGSGKIDEAVEKTHLSEPQVRTIYAIQHHAKHKDIAEIEGITEKASSSRVSRVREKKKRAQNTLQTFKARYSIYNDLKKEPLHEDSANGPDDREHDWREYSEDMKFDADFIERISRKTFLYPTQCFVLRCLQRHKDMVEVAGLMNIEPPPSLESLSSEKTLYKRYIPKLRNHRRRAYNTLQFLDGEYDFKEFSWKYAYDD